MSTYSVYDIKIENKLIFPAGVTAGYVLAINADGTTNWVESNSMNVDFNASTQSITLGTTISFTNLSDPTPVHNFWEFGDGSFSTASSPNKVYNLSGSFSVKLNACDDTSGGIETKSGYIIVSLQYLLDEYTGATAAYSTRLLRIGYTGSCMRVRRSSDDAEQDIGFVNRTLDTTSLSSFVGASNGFVKIWYDQSGMNFDLEQSTTSLQPRIVNSGTIETLEGKPSLFFVNGTNNYLVTNGTKTISQPLTKFSISKLTANSGIDASILCDSKSTSGDRAFIYHSGTSDAPINTLIYGARTFRTIESSTADTRLISILFNGSGSIARTEGVQRTTLDPGNGGFVGGITLGKNTNLNGYEFSGHIAEFVVYASNKSTDFVNIENNINSWWGAY